MCKKTLLLAFLLAVALIPPPAAGSSRDDPAGDERYTPLRLVGVPTTCGSPRIDVTHAAAESDGSTVTFRMEVLDFDAPLACKGDAAGAVQGWERIWFFALSGPGGVLIGANAQPDYAGGYVFAYSIGEGFSGEVTGPEAGSLDGNLLTWTVPLVGVRPGTTEAYDYRGLTLRPSVWTYESAIVGPPHSFVLGFSVFDQVPLGPVAV